MPVELPEEKMMECVRELRERLKEVMSMEMYADTSVFLRFLKARNFDINAAENMLKKHINWREENKIDSITLWYSTPEVLTKYFTMNHLGFDKEGSSVAYMGYGNFDILGCLKAVTKVDILNFVTHYFETDIKRAENQGDKITKEKQMWTYIYNMENFSFIKATHKESISMCIEYIRVYEANYPERLKCVIFINCSMYFKMIFAILKQFLHSETINKFKIFGKEGWQEELLTRIDADVLPAFLGGNRTDPDGNPMCKTFLNHGGCIPEKYFTIKNKSEFSSKPEVKKLVVGRSSKERVELLVTQSDSYIEWEFEVKEQDVNFKIMYENNNFEMEDIFCTEKVETSTLPEEGIFKCDKPGTYYLEFDNSHNNSQPKEVFYTAKVICPDDNDPSSSIHL